ncbi:MAG: hypothetical protein PHG23_02785 [Candidatus Pacebacteria bacterium]|nr:hypothetical protein [Candidatus Paceibacterota bacterium]
MLSNNSLNYGRLFNNIDANVGIGFNYFNGDVRAIGATTTTTTEIRSIVIKLIPEINIGYYYSDKKLKPFTILSLQSPMPIYNQSVTDGIKYNNKEWGVTAGILFGLDLFIDNISIGAGIGPLIGYNNSDSNLAGDVKTQSNYISSNLNSEIRFKYFFQSNKRR